MLQVGSVVDGKYKVLNKIGQGGMSVVYLALNERANKTWAIKEVRKDGVQDFTTVRQGLIAETNILKELNHKYLPSIVDVIDEDDTFLIVMDYIQGQDLNTILKKSLEQDGIPPMPEDVISWGKQLCDVLYYLHTRKSPIIYRDMKPANVMLKPDGEISLIDFGTARVFKTGNSEDTTCLGTPGYAAPEQYGGNGQTTPQTDIYCLGATLHHLITGRNPAATPFNFPRITQCRPTLLDESPREMRNTILGLEQIIEKCTQYEPADRYQSCAELMYDLEHPEELGLPYRRKLRNRMLAFGSCAALSLIFAGVSLFGYLMESSTQKSGYDYYMQRAATASTQEKYEQYRNAIALNPTREEAYLKLLEALQADNEFSAEDDAVITKALTTRDNNRTNDNESYLEANEAGYVTFAYQMGLAYYYTQGSGGSKISAQGWFSKVTEADIDAIDFGENESRKAGWKARAEILGKICSYSSKIGSVNAAGDAEVTYKDYWVDMMELVDSDIASADNTTTELRLYDDIVYQIYSRTKEFKEDAGLSQDVVEQSLAKIKEKAHALSSDGSSVNQQLLSDLDEMFTLAEEKIKSTYTLNQYALNNEAKGGDA